MPVVKDTLSEVNLTAVGNGRLEFLLKFVDSSIYNVVLLLCKVRYFLS